MFINLVSSFYPLSETHLEKYEEDWDWDRIINNNNLILTEKSIDKFNHKLLWGICISKNETLSWTLEFIEKYKEELDWNEISRNKAIPWSIELIDNYKDRLAMAAMIVGRSSGRSTSTVTSSSACLCTASSAQAVVVRAQ